MKTYNSEIADAFNEIADLMSILSEDSFKIRAYREAARRLKEGHAITKKDTDKKKLMELPRIGEALADKIIQYITRGKIDYLERLRREIPKAVQEMLKIPHLGPVRVRDLYISLGIKTKKDLLKAAKNGAIAQLSGFGDKLVSDIVNAIEKRQEKKKRHKREDVEPVAKKLKTILEKINGVTKVEIAGSYRRGAREVGDLDILVVGPVGIGRDLPMVETQITQTFKNITMLASGETKVAFVIFPENLQVDIRFVPDESYGAALLYFTGSKDYNVFMRKVAIEKGMLLNEYGLFKEGEYLAGETEEDVFEKLGLPYKEPSKRK